MNFYEIWYGIDQVAGEKTQTRNKKIGLDWIGLDWITETGTMTG